MIDADVNVKVEINLISQDEKLGWNSFSITTTTFPRISLIIPRITCFGRDEAYDRIMTLIIFDLLCKIEMIL